MLIVRATGAPSGSTLNDKDVSCVRGIPLTTRAEHVHLCELSAPGISLDGVGVF